MKEMLKRCVNVNNLVLWFTRKTSTNVMNLYKARFYFKVFKETYMRKF